MEASDLSLCEIKLKRSLMISPNLDALLEHEERTRAPMLSTVPVVTASDISSRSVSQELPVGLPPPPRRVGKVKTPPLTWSAKSNSLLPEDTEVKARRKPVPAPIFVPRKNSSTSNPYINPAPTMAEVIVDAPSISVTTEPSMNPPSHEQFLEQSSYPFDSRDISPITFTMPWSPVLDISGGYSGRLSRTSRVSKPPHPYSSSKVDAPMRNLGKRHSFDHRPHARRLSASSMNTTSSHEPAETVENEPRISISSTIYPPSCTLSDSYCFHNDPPPSPTKQNRDPYMETYLLSQTESSLDSTSMDYPQLSPIQFSKPSLSSCSSSPDLTHSPKPPLPTTPKPAFYRTSMKPGNPEQRSLILTERLDTLPPTTNFLASEARTDLVRKTRKLARVFGQTPRAGTTPTQEASLSVMSRCSSVLHDLDWSILRQRRSVLRSESEPSLVNGVRRHSMPLSSDDMPFVTNVSPSSQGYQGYLSPSNDPAGYHARIQIRSVSGGDIAAVMPEADRKTRSLTVSPQPQFEKMFEEAQVDEDRRQKRDRLAKLHRFLGSRVPVNLVLGIDDIEASLPPPPTSTSPDSRATWIRRRRSSSAILTSPHWTDDTERVKKELNDKEKLINVRRAVKMEKVCTYFFSTDFYPNVIRLGFWCSPASNSLSHSLLRTTSVNG